MIGDRVALLVGLFGVPLLILIGGRRFRHQSPNHRRRFWGATLGHTAGLLASLTATLVPPIWWHGGSWWRDFLVHWSMLVGAAVGVAIAQLMAD